MEALSRVLEDKVMIGTKEKRPQCKEQRSNNGSKKRISKDESVETDSGKFIGFVAFELPATYFGKETQCQCEINLKCLVQKQFPKNENHSIKSEK